MGETPAADVWDLFGPAGVVSVENTAPLPPAAPPQGPGPRFKPQGSLGSTHLLFAYQSLDEDYWTPIENHFAFGLETSFERKGDWIGGEGGLSFVMTDGEDLFIDPVGGNTKVKASLIMVELYGGIHRTFFRDSRLSPYVGAGASMFYVDGEQEFKPSSGPDRCDSGHELTFGLYAHGGLSYQINELFQIGLDLRVVGLTEVDVLEGTGDVDYRQLALFIGYGG